MSETQRSDTDWIGVLRESREDGEGSDEAFTALFNKWFNETIRLARRRMSNVNCREADGEDVAIDAFHSLFRGISENRFPKLYTSNDLWRLLAVITARKAVQQTRRQYRKKRGANSVRGESVFVRRDDHAGGLAEAAAAPENTEVEFRELTRLLISSLECSTLQKIARQRLDGATNRQIADNLRCTTRTVERKIRRIREQWESSGLAESCQ